MTASVRTRLALLVVGLVSLPLFLYRLGAPPLQNWDEAIHAEVSREMLQTHDWGTMHFADNPYFRKPPLKFWLTGLSELAFGEHEWTVRMWSALSGIALVLLLTLWVVQETGSPGTGLLAGLIFLSGRFVFFHAFRTGETDGLLALFTVAALYGYWRAKPHSTHRADPRWLYLAFGAVALAVMTKSAAGALPVAIGGVEFVLTRSWRRFRWRDLWGPLGLAAVIVLPWHLYETARWGGWFWNEYFGLHVVQRATEVLHNPGASEGWYGPILYKRFFPFSLWLIPAVVWTLRGWFVRRREELLWVVWVVLVFLLFTLARTKFDWYLLPLYPAAAVLVAKYLVALRGAVVHPLVRYGHALAFGGFVALLPSFIPRASALWALVPSGWLPAAVPPAWIGAAFGVALFAVTTRPRIRGAAFWIATVPVVGSALAFNLLTARHDGVPGPMRDVAAAIAQRPGSHTVVVYGVDLEHTPYAYYYLRGIPTATLRDAGTDPTAIPAEPSSGTALVVERGYALSPTLAERYPAVGTFGEYTLRRAP